MKLNNYDKLSVYAVISFAAGVSFTTGANANKFVCCHTYDNIRDLVVELQQKIGPSLRKSEVSKITLYAKVHSASFEQHYIPEIYMTGFEKRNYEMIETAGLYQTIEDKLNTLKEQAGQYVNTTYLQYFGIFYEDK